MHWRQSLHVCSSKAKLLRWRRPRFQAEQHAFDFPLGSAGYRNQTSWHLMRVTMPAFFFCELFFPAGTKRAHTTLPTNFPKRVGDQTSCGQKDAHRGHSFWRPERVLRPPAICPRFGMGGLCVRVCQPHKRRKALLSFLRSCVLCCTAQDGT